MGEVGANRVRAVLKGRVGIVVGEHKPPEDLVGLDRFHERIAPETGDHVLDRSVVGDLEDDALDADGEEGERAHLAQAVGSGQRLPHTL